MRYREDAATVFIFGGIFLTGFGSAYYHWNPDDGTLFWDRLPMALAFSAILAKVVGERIDERAGAILLWPLLALGVFSLLWWRCNRRPAALWLGAVLSLPGAAGAVPAVPAEIHRHRLLARRRRALRARQGVRIQGRRDLFGRRNS